MVIASEPIPPGGVPGPPTKENVPVSLEGSSDQTPWGERLPALTTVVVVAAPAGDAAIATVPAPDSASVAVRHATARNGVLIDVPPR
jgi:hypothetical protein